jgi:hypothetical protein
METKKTAPRRNAVEPNHRASQTTGGHSNDQTQSRNGIFLSKQTMDTILKHKSGRGAEMFALLGFYHYTALWQKTNQPKASVEYVAKGLNWKCHKVRRIRRSLLELKLIEDVRAIDPRTNKVTGWFVRLRLFQPISVQREKPHSPKSQRVDLSTTNALRSGNGNALRAGNGVSSSPANAYEEKRGVANADAHATISLFSDVPRLPFPKSARAMYKTLDRCSDLLERYDVDVDPDRDGKFFKDFSSRDWCYPSGQLVDNWLVAYIRRRQHIIEKMLEA